MNPSMPVDWSEISPDILSFILKKLVAVDAIRFGAVCPQWNLIFKSNKACNQQTTPWHMTILKDKPDTTANFYSMTDNINYTISFPSPPIKYRYYIGSSHGWLITLSEQCELHIVQPVTGVQISLPPITTIPFIEAVRDSDDCIMKFSCLIGGYEEIFPTSMAGHFSTVVFSATPSSNNYTVMLSYAFVEKLTFARAGDEAWSAIDNPYEHIEDMIFHKGKFHTLHSDGMMVAWDWDSENKTIKPTVVAPKFSELDDGDFLKLIDSDAFLNDITEDKISATYYKLAEFASGDQLLIVIIYSRIQILSWDNNMLKWTQLTSLGNQALFLNGICQQPIWVEATLVPGLQRNCIYLYNAVYCVETGRREKLKLANYYKLVKKDPNLFFWLIPNLL